MNLKGSYNTTEHTPSVESFVGLELRDSVADIHDGIQVLLSESSGSLLDFVPGACLLERSD